MTRPGRIFDAKVVAVRRIGGAGTRIDLAVPPGFAEPRAGQFVQVRTVPESVFRLRRPFSICSWNRGSAGGEIGILFSVVGDGSRWLDARSVGDRVEIEGPLGHPFEAVPDRFPVLLAGGRGIAPILLLAMQLSGRIAEGRLLYGARDSRSLFPVECSPYPVEHATLDGSVGETGTVLDLLERLLASGAVPSGAAALYACGPTGMLEAVSRLAVARDLPVQVSLETTFGCGTGLCAGCAIPIRGPGREPLDPFRRYAFACSDGPVFDGARVDWPEVSE